MRLINPHFPQVDKELEKRAWEKTIWPHPEPTPSLTEGLPCWIGAGHHHTYHHITTVGEPVSLLHFDAHGDMDEYESPEDMHHGNWITRLFDEGLLLDVYQVGRRTEHSRAFKHADAGFRPDPKAIRSLKGPIFVTIDIDVFDPSIAPATGMRVPDGLTFREVRETLQLARGLTFCGADIMEYDPWEEGAGVTASLIAGLVFELAYLLEE